MYYLRLITLVIVVAMLSCSESQDSTKNWYKGNLHTHSYWSDGDEFPDVIMNWYKTHDYQFVALSDHNILAQGDKWKVIPQDSVYQNRFKKYLKLFGSDWVDYNVDSIHQTRVKLKTYEEYRVKFEEEEEFLILQSEEISDEYDGKPLHLNATNVQELIPAQGGNSVVDVLQNNIDAVRRQRELLDIPMIVHINHPNFHHAITLEDMIALRDEKFFEVYNGHPAVNNSGDSTHMSTESMWDYINIAYTMNNQPLMYGLATDDSHNYHVQGRKWSNAGRGWIMVHTDSLNPRSLVAAMEAGDFYASTGVSIEEIKTENNTLSIDIAAEEGVTYEIEFIGCKKGQIKAETLHSVRSDQASFDLSEEYLFVRCKITSSKLHSNPIEDLTYETAWTQPVMVSQGSR